MNSFNVPQQQVSKNHMKMYTAGQLKPGKEYKFIGTALEGSYKSLITNKPREFWAQFEKVEGGDLKFKFNGMDLYISTGEVNNFTYVGYNNHGGHRKSRKNLKSRKIRGTRRR